MTVTQNNTTQQPTKILVVDDDRFSRMVVAKFLTQQGYQVTEAINGRQALVLFNRIVPDLILLDVEMPNINGFEVCATIRKSPIGKSIPIIMLTSREDDQAIKLAFSAGTTDYICKPVNLKLLAHRLPGILKASQAVREARKTALPKQPSKRLLSKGSWQWVIHSDQFRCSAGINRLVGDLPEKASLSDYLAHVKEDEREQIKDALYLAASRREPFSFEHKLVNTSKGERTFLMHGKLIKERPAIVEGTLQDITERKTANASVQRMAFQDSLTGLTNKQTFISHLDRAINHAQFNKKTLAVIYIDLDDFKKVNDAHGQNVGDQLLMSIGQTIKNCVRSSDALSDNQNEDISRIGGDKFAVLLNNLSSPEGAGSVAKRILNELESPDSETRGPLKSSASIGISCYPKDGASSNELLANAEQAMRHAKLTGKHYYRYFDQRMNSPAYNRFGLEEPLKQALINNEFRLQYQPQIDIQRGTIVGVEALIRWHSKDHGIVSPERFIPIAEKLGIMAKVDQWVMETACTEVQSWHEEGLQPINLSLNIANSRFISNDFADSTQFALEKSGFPAHQLVLELLENSIMKDAHATTQRLLEIRELGCLVALDNFGSGLSSINYLRRFNLDYLKIDRQFIRQVMNDADDAAIISTIMDMARNLDMRVIAQGIESKSQLKFLHTIGCEFAQGFLFAKPVSGEKIFKALMKRASAKQKATA